MLSAAIARPHGNGFGGTVPLSGDLIAGFNGEFGSGLCKRQRRSRGTDGCGRTKSVRPFFLHDGSLATLEAVVEFYSEGGRPNSYRDPEIRPRRFSPEEKRSLTAFILTLNGRIQAGQ